ncbi:autoinducer binding domain-containing protein [Erwinia sp. V71]|uniref:helix-turn-helix transcriptional regulator n=1 Tax=Erwinia sp. V71 TaxID=3369424 RepID=UPI003F611BB6
MRENYFSNSDKNEAIRQFLSDSLQKYGEINYVYGVMNKRNTDEMVIISDLSDELVNNYLDNKRQNIDPVIINALNRISSFPWNEDMTINSQWTVRKVFEPVSSFSGYAFIVHDHNNNLAILSLYMNKLTREEIENNIISHKDEIQGLLIRTHEMMLNAYHEEAEEAKFVLTTRESEILYWSSTGKTYTEVADTLHITVSTVKFHIANVVKKMGVKNAKHAISLGKELNMVTPLVKKHKKLA